MSENMKGEFGEPWKRLGNHLYVETDTPFKKRGWPDKIDRFCVTVSDPNHLCKPSEIENISARIEMCINALDGLNPDAVRELIEAVGNVTFNRDKHGRIYLEAK